MFDTTELRSLQERRAAATREAVLESAWRLSRQRGLTGWSLRELARDVGLAAPTLYAYFDAKSAIYDAMFRDGYESLDAVANRWDVDTSGSRSVRQLFTEAMSEWVAFCTADPTRYQLMFQRVIPDFVPSAEAYAASIASYQRFRRQFAAIGITDDSHLDLWTAIATGLVDQQVSNDPGGDRWIRLVGMAVDLFCDHVGIPRDEGDNE